MHRNQNEWVILGITLEGEAFTYPNWPERLCGMLAMQSDSNRLSYSDYLLPTHIDGLPAVVLNAELEKVDPEAYKLVRQFAEENRLKVRSGRNSDPAAAAAKHPALNVDRRDLCERRGS